MKITRRQLRRLINEVRIKPEIPNVPSAEAQGKIDDLARSDGFRKSADSMAVVFGYPEDRNYSDDLKIYDDVGNIPHTERLYDEIVQTIIDIYDDEVHNYSLDKVLYNALNTKSDSEFDDYLKVLAQDAYTYLSKKYGGAGIPHPFNHEIKIEGVSGIRRIYQALKVGSEII